MKKIKEEQLATIRQQQTELNSLLNELGYLETTKHGLLHKFAGISQQVEEYKVELEKEYGTVNINIETGEYTEITETEEETPVAHV